jgi:uncharacterized protein (DUF1810 family)
MQDWLALPAIKTIVNMANSFNLQRFVNAQAPVYADVLDELRAGKKTTHWMWFIFPQLKELGRSAMARHYGITSLAEALAYLDHPLLGKRLLECTELMLAANGQTALEILGAPDDLKFRSCMTLFRAARPELPVWDAALGKYFGGELDAATIALL